MSRIRIAVVGAGHLGRIHTRLLRTLPQFELAVVVDPLEAARAEVARLFDVPVDSDHRPWIERVDAVVVAAPTVFHHGVTCDFLSAGVAALVEKPLASDGAQAAELVRLAKLRKAVLQVGHVERFNPAWLAVRPRIGEPLLIEGVREGVFSFRSTDVGVVFDLMIHDIDLALDLARSPVVDVEATGAAYLGAHEDTAQARLGFENGATALLSASRVSHGAARALKIRCRDSLAAIDFQAKTAHLTRFDERLVRGELDVAAMTPAERSQIKDRLLTELFVREEIPVPAADAITAELVDFAAAIRTGRSPAVTGADGAEAVQVAERIVAAIAADQASRNRREPTILTGPHWRKAGAEKRRQAG
jgi:predicted dehydrogenase